MLVITTPKPHKNSGAHGKPLSIATMAIMLFFGLYLGGCATPGGHYGAGERQPSDIRNACNILKEKRHWVQPLNATQKRWSTPIDLTLAIIYQESSFKANARPKPLPGHFKPASSAYGYAQAINGTWKHYKKNTKKTHHKRYIFAHATNFIGWYVHMTRKHTSIKGNDAGRIYLAYHEGWGGYNRKTYRAKPWLIRTAKKVRARQRTFRAQLKSCYLPRELLEQGGTDSKQYKGGWF